uniref:Phycobiliprotein ApcE n=1 Tax=Polysiphonia sertularioides TaxID=945028 RepID=A0A1Z1MGP1_9FLOR|nr:phycobilisome linker polypeptide [Polysiphonia sertularioides]
MIIRASGGSNLVKPKLYKTSSFSSILQAEQQDRFLQLGELSQLVSFFNSGNKRLNVAKLITSNADFLVSKASDKIFVGGSPFSYLERPQAAFSDSDSYKVLALSKELSGNTSTNLINNASYSLFNTNDSLPPGFKPISVVKYGSERMKKSLRDLDWFLRYLTYAIVAGDTNILSVNIRGLRELIDNACSSAATIVALREMRKWCLTLFNAEIDSQKLVSEYFSALISEFESPKLGDKIRRGPSKDIQGLRLPQTYNKAGFNNQKFVMKSSLSNDEKKLVIRACYRQVFERDISKAYGLIFKDLESQAITGQLSIKEFIRCLGRSSIYKKQFGEVFVNSRVLELSFRHFLGRGLSSLEEFRKYFAIISDSGINKLVDTLINSQEYSDYFGEETVPYLRTLGEEAQESRNWGPKLRLFNYSTPFRKIPDFITLFADYKSKAPNRHAYGIGNDHLLIQFGAIFPNTNIGIKSKPSSVTRDTRRLLIRNGPGIYNQISNPSQRGFDPRVMTPLIFNARDKNFTIKQVMSAIYIRVFGRFVYEEELSSIKKYERQFESNILSVRNFIRLLVKSSLFRSLYWNKLYICKSIEYIHNKLIGRPTYTRQEINKYFDIVYKKGYYEMIDSIIDSREYTESFGDIIVPYERYIVASALSDRSFPRSIITTLQNSSHLDKKTVNSLFSLPSLSLKVLQGVAKRRDQSKIFVLSDLSDLSERLKLIRAAYRQIFEREVRTISIANEFSSIENAFLKSQLTVKELIRLLGYSSLYRHEFYSPYPNTKVIELGTKHFLGRAPNNQAEIRYYNQILASKGLQCFVDTIISSNEYNQIFGNNIVPYRRYPTLPAANFGNTEKLYNSLTKQNKSIVIPNFSCTENY